MTVVINRTETRIPAGAPVPVSVNGVAISRDAITREIQNHPAPKPALAWQQAARALVIRELLLQEAGRLGIKAAPLTEGEGRRETDEEALLRQLTEQEIVTPEPDDDVCRRYYANNSARFRSPDVYEASHILIAARKDAAEAFAEARRQAEAVLAELQAHPEQFANLAAVHSACSSGAQGGNLGQITEGQTTPEFEAALFGLSPGTITRDVVATRYGFHIIRLERKSEGRLLPYELVAERIAGYLKDGVERRAAAQYIARLVSRATIIGIEIEGAEAHRVN
jgi:peptidyl-prolyl cis-trans isomerase C